MGKRNLRPKIIIFVPGGKNKVSSPLSLPALVHIRNCPLLSCPPHNPPSPLPGTGGNRPNQTKVKEACPHVGTNPIIGWVIENQHTLYVTNILLMWLIEIQGLIIKFANSS